VYRIIDKDKNIQWVEDHKASIFENGKFIGIDGVVINITKTKEAEEKLNEKLKELRIINNLMVGRELKMVELKRKIQALEGQIKNKKK
jgi:polyhydroxyalkanoate synthesis regulator phasin